MSEVSWRDYVDARIAAMDRRLTELDDATKQRVALAADGLRQRLDGMNELRGAMNDLAQRAASRDQVEALKDKVSEMRTGHAVTTALVTLVVSVIVTAIARWIVP